MNKKCSVQAKPKAENILLTENIYSSVRREYETAYMAKMHISAKLAFYIEQQIPTNY